MAYSDYEFEIFSRQFILKEFSEDKIAKLEKSKVTIIGVGGIFTVDDAWEKIAAGASLIQLYTGLVFEGPGIARSIVSGLKKRVASEGFESISDVIGINS